MQMHIKRSFSFISFIAFHSRWVVRKEFHPHLAKESMGLSKPTIEGRFFFKNLLSPIKLPFTQSHIQLVEIEMGRLKMIQMRIYSLNREVSDRSNISHVLESDFREGRARRRLLLPDHSFFSKFIRLTIRE